MSLNKDVSVLQEKEVARKLGGKLAPSSGSGKFSGGDVYTEDFLIECKTVTKDQVSFTVKKEWMSKAKEQSFEQNKPYSALAFRFSPNGDDYIVMPIETFRDLLDCQRQLEDIIE